MSDISTGIHDDFWLDPPKYTQDAYGNDLYLPENPSHPSWRRMSNWHDLGPNGERLRSDKTKWVYVHPSNNKLWQLRGGAEGREGVMLARELEGVDDLDYEIRYSEGAYTIGSKPERVDYKMRKVNAGVQIQPPANPWRPEEPNGFSYGLIHASWNASLSEKVPGFLGCFTRVTGWRWLPVLKAASKVTFSTDPRAFDNNSVTLPLNFEAPWPMFAKRAKTKLWQATLDDLDQHGLAHGTIAVGNAGTWDSWPKYLITGHGDVQIEDYGTGRMIDMPTFYASDGSYMLVDTDPTKRTITTESDPVDTQLYKYLRNSQLLDILLHDQLAAQLPAQRRIPGGIGFDGKVPPQTIAAVKVTHSNPNGSVTMYMPQYFRGAWS
ncbi:minor tail protein [Mycobacterium phage MacnCheese]|uniref:Minor tail protein n=1 Tax=Mycobacterium phage MacnCheese TaxID=2927982 RepID=I6X3A0_9CAUD|nr:minor tail protein [Mycobacterium phage MacnCheese]AFN37717.1 minor tail protein [Mycobacterium phage MacnCheese]